MKFRGVALYKRFGAIALSLLILISSFITSAFAGPLTYSQPSVRQANQVGPQEVIWCDFDDHACVMNVLTGALATAVQKGLISIKQQNIMIQEAAIQLAAIGTTAPFPGAMFGLLHNVPGYSGGGTGTGGGGAGGGFLSLTEELNLAEPKPYDPFDFGSTVTFSSWATIYDGSWGKAHCKFELGSLSQYDDPYLHDSDHLVASGYGFSLTLSI